MKVFFRLLLVAVLGIAAVAGIRHYARPKPVSVVVAPVEHGPVESTVANTRAGTVKACRRAKVAPRTGGQVATLAVGEGDRVTTGQVLVVLWNDDLKAQLRLSASTAVVAEARVNEACLTAEVAEREAQRLQQLASRNLVAEERVDRATTDARARQAACRASQGSLEVSRAQVDSSRAALELTYLKAPFDGVVAEINAELGEIVTPSPPGILTPPAVDLIDDSCLYITAPIDEVDAPALRTGMSACVTLDAFPAPRCEATVRRIAPYVLDREKQARTVEVEVSFGHLDGRAELLPGYSADVEIVLERRERVLRVPTEAVLEQSEGAAQVLVLRESDGRLESRRFRPGLSNWRYTEVLSGVALGERVVMSVDREGVEAGAHAIPETAPSAP